MKINGNLVIIIVLAMVLVVSGCTTEATKTQTQNVQNTNGMNCTENTCDINTAETANAEVQKVEVYHFHATNQCSSCIAVGKLAEETVNTYFADEVKSSKVVFGHINGELPENRDLVMKYGATGASLWIGTYTKDGQFKAEQNVNVWYKINNKEDYMTYLKGVIEQKLAGE
jgi:hypothetical protein